LRSPSWEQTDWVTICTAYDRLIEIADSPVARADLLRRSGHLSEAAQWYRIALNHNGSAPAREFLQRRLVELSRPRD
jgi:RNA polymerase sigma-70 factor (ECF subfamily)